LKIQLEGTGCSDIVFTSQDILISPICMWFITLNTIIFFFFFFAFLSFLIKTDIMPNTQDLQKRNGFHSLHSYCWQHLYYSTKVSLHMLPIRDQGHWICLCNPYIEYCENNLLFHILHSENVHSPFELMCDDPLGLCCKSLHPS